MFLRASSATNSYSSPSVGSTELVESLTEDGGKMKHGRIRGKLTSKCITELRSRRNSPIYRVCVHHYEGSGDSGIFTTWISTAPLTRFYRTETSSQYRNKLLMAYNPSGASNSDQTSSMENESVELLSAMMGGDIDLDLARRLLRKCNGDVQKAADALLEGTAKGMLEETAVIRRTGSLNTIRADERPRSRTAGRPGTPVQPSVIDLTGEGEDDELSRALNLSMETHSNEQNTRVDRDHKSAPPDPAWAMVRSNVPLPLDNICAVVSLIEGMCRNQHILRCRKTISPSVVPLKPASKILQA